MSVDGHVGLSRAASFKFSISFVLLAARVSLGLLTHFQQLQEVPVFTTSIWTLLFHLSL